MAVVFKSKAGADVLMLRADAEQVLAALGREAAAEGVFVPDQIGAALATFARAEQASVPPANSPAEEDDDLESRGGIALGRRAWPLLELLRQAQARGVPVTWGTA